LSKQIKILKTTITYIHSNILDMEFETDISKFKISGFSQDKRGPLL